MAVSDGDGEYLLRGAIYERQFKREKRLLRLKLSRGKPVDFATLFHNADDEATAEAVMRVWEAVEEEG